MIALTQEKREELNTFINASIEQRCTVYTLKKQRELEELRDQIALAVLTAEPVAEIKCLEDLSLEVVNVSDGFNLGRHAVYTAPPVPEIRTDQHLGLQVSVDVSTCDEDSGNRYFGRVTSLSESNGEIVLLVEDPEKNFDTTIPLPSFDGYNEDVIRELQAAFIQAITKFGVKIKE